MNWKEIEKKRFSGPTCKLLVGGRGEELKSEKKNVGVLEKEHSSLSSKEIPRGGPWGLSGQG